MVNRSEMELSRINDRQKRLPEYDPYKKPPAFLSTMAIGLRQYATTKRVNPLINS
jgi:hypothetical protein